MNKSSLENVLPPRPIDVLASGPKRLAPANMAAGTFALALGYWLLSELGQYFAMPVTQITLVWLPSGLATAAVCLYGRRVLPGLLLGVLASKLTFFGPSLAAVVITVGGLLQPIAAAALLRRARFRIRMERHGDIAAFCLLGAALSCTLSATLGVAGLWLQGSVGSGAVDTPLAAWFHWWLGDTIGVILLAPFLFALHHAWRSGVRVEAPRSLILLLAVTLLLSWTLFYNHTGHYVADDRHLLFLAAPLVAWAALRHQHVGATGTVLLVALLAACATAQGYGPFTATPNVPGVIGTDAVDLLVFQVTMMVLGLGLAVTVRLQARHQRVAGRLAGQLRGDVARHTEELGRTNRELEASKSRLQAVVEASSDWFWETDTEHRFTYFSLDSLDGFDLRGRLGKTRWELGGDAAGGSAKWRAHREQLDNHQPIRDFVYRAILPNGTVRHWRVSGAPRFDSDGRFLGYRGAASDVTAEIEARRTLEENNLQLRIIAANIPGLIYRRVQRPDGTLRHEYLSEGIRGLLGLDAAEMMEDNRRLLAAIHPEDRDAWRTHAASPERIGTSYAFEHRCVLADGSVKWVTNNGHSYRRRNGDLVWDGLLLDITQRKQTERAFEEVAFNLGERVKEMRCLLAVAERVQDGVGLDAAFYERVVEELRRAMQFPDRTSVEITVDRATYRTPGAASPHPALCSPITLSGAEIGTICVGYREHAAPDDPAKPFMAEERDLVDGVARIISRELAGDLAEQRLRHSYKMKAIGQLTGGVAHDFNNLLSVIQGNLQLLERRIHADDDLMRLLGPAIEATARGGRLTGRLLAFTRDDASAPPERIDLDEAIREQVPMLDRMLGEQVNIELELAASGAGVMLDRGAFDNAVMNLAINARDAMPAGGCLRIRSRVSPPSDSDYRVRGMYHLDFCDTGHGIPGKDLERIFDTFYTTKNPGVGTGMGLSLVRDTVVKAGGRVYATSEPGRGAVIHLELPLCDAEATAEPEAPARSAGQAGGPDEAGQATLPGCVLLVEDDDQLRASIELLLLDLGCRVYTASDGEEALQSLLDHHAEIEAVLSDVVMPGALSGYQLARRVHESWPEIGVLLTSGYPQEAAGFDASAPLLPKPFTQQQLAAALAKVTSATCSSGDPQ